MIIDRGEASELLSGKKRYVIGAGEEDAAFFAKQKVSRKMLKFGFKMCGSI